MTGHRIRFCRTCTLPNGERKIEGVCPNFGSRPEPEPELKRQRVLFAGLACLPGQENLFETDGCEDGVRD